MTETRLGLVVNTFLNAVHRLTSLVGGSKITLGLGTNTICETMKLHESKQSWAKPRLCFSLEHYLIIRNLVLKLRYLKPSAQDPLPDQ